MKAWALLAGIIAAALFIAALTLRPPAPLPASASPEAFSAVRAMADIRAIARKPHPMGSSEAVSVQDYLLARMIQLRLAPVVRPFGQGDQAGRNLLGVLPGLDRSKPAVLLMAHTDTAPTAPGAADDSTGVAAILETVRALQASGPRQRDVMVLFTDGEEPGLYGSHAFFTADPARAHVGAVINLEARGDRGRATMFESHREAGALIGFLTAHGALHGASALMPDIYRRLPNDTDLTQALKRGYVGLNYAFIGNFAAYHRATDTPTNLDPGSVQSIGGQVLAAARALSAAPTLPARAQDQVYGDVLGGSVLQYPVAAGWVLFVLAVAGVSLAAWRMLAARQTSIGGMIGGYGAAMGLVALLAAALWLEGLIRARIAGPHLAPFLRHDEEAFAGSILICGGVAMLWLWLARKVLKPASLWLGALKVTALGALALQIAAPLDAFILAWPLLLGAMAATHVSGGPGPQWRAAPFILAALAQVFYWSGLLYPAMGQQLPVILAPFAALAALLVLPLAPSAGRLAGIGAGVLAVLGVGLSLAAMRP